MVCRFGPSQIIAPVHEPRPHSFNFQRGNLVFTSASPSPSARSPPLRWNTMPRTTSSSNEGSSSSTTVQHDSGYNSERSKLYNSPDDHRCKSTCKIVLSANVDQRSRGPLHEQVMSYRFSTVPEGCEECSSATCHVCSKDIARLTISKDVASQTSDVGSRSCSMSEMSSASRKKKVKEPKEDEKKKTVHIDVYCTGTEEDQSSDSSIETEMISPQTVFEDKKVKVSHVRANSRDLPRGFRDKKAFLKRGQKNYSVGASTSFESDGSLYPSSTSFPLERYDSTSWKDTVSDFGSILNTATVTPSDSFEFFKTANQLTIKNLALKNQARNRAFIRNKDEENDSDDSSNCDELRSWDLKNWDLKKDATVKKTTGTNLPVEEIAEKLKQLKETKNVPSRAQSVMTSPFGERTEHMMRASRFGSVITMGRKPGHHVGPSKNPSCECEHCREYFDEMTRKRSLSLSDFERRIMKPGRGRLY